MILMSLLIWKTLFDLIILLWSPLLCWTLSNYPLRFRTWILDPCKFLFIYLMSLRAIFFGWFSKSVLLWVNEISCIDWLLWLKLKLTALCDTFWFFILSSSRVLQSSYSRLLIFWYDCYNFLYSYFFYMSFYFIYWP